MRMGKSKQSASPGEAARESVKGCHKVLQMIGVLHAHGYQSLRLFPYVRNGTGVGKLPLHITSLQGLGRALSTRKATIREN